MVLLLSLESQLDRIESLVFDIIESLLCLESRVNIGESLVFLESGVVNIDESLVLLFLESLFCTGSPTLLLMTSELDRRGIPRGIPSWGSWPGSGKSPPGKMSANTASKGPAASS